MISGSVGGSLRESVVRLVGIDVDGTLVGSSGAVHPRVWAAAEIALARGIHLALCSGRPAFGLALGFARQLDPGGWHIFQNGASIVQLAAGISRSVPIPPVWVRRLIEQARSSNQVLELYADDSYVTESTAPWAKDHAELLGVEFAPSSFDSLLQPAVRAQWLLSPSVAQEFMSASYPGLEVAQSTSPMMPDTRFVGLTNQGVSKGSALRAIAGEYGVPLTNVMYVGDAGNDLSALRIVGHPVAMANSDPAVLETARYTVGHVDQGALAEALGIAIATVTA